MKKIISIILAFCMMLCVGAPVLAADSPLGCDTNVEMEEDSHPLGMSGTTQIQPFSGFEDLPPGFKTQIRLTVTDRKGTPIKDAGYDLFTMSGWHVETLVTDGNGIAFSGELPIENVYFLQESFPPEGYQPNWEQKYIYAYEYCNPSLIDITVVYDPVTGWIEIYKTDEDGNPLAGVGFEVYHSDMKEPIDTIITDDAGYAITSELPYGKYEVYEYLPPEGFEGKDYFPAMISGQDEIFRLDIVNNRSRGDIRVYKLGNDGLTIQGAVFSIFNAENDSWIEDITTNSSGYAYARNLPLGNYYLVEKSVPSPYALDTARHEAAITYSGQMVYLTVTNNRAGKSGKVKILKTDDSGNPLSGVVFGIYRKWDNKKHSELSTGENGIAESDLLIPGDYYLTELKGKDGYTMVTERIPVTIGGSGDTVEVYVVNPKTRIYGKVQITKQDDAGTPLEGVRFGIYCNLGNLISELVTGQDGTTVSDALNEGEYYIKELAGLPGYLTDDLQHPFSITTNNSIVPVAITNPRITGAVRVIKTGGSDPLPGVRFGVYDSDGSKLYDLTTDEDGIAVSPALYYGAYELRELSTLPGYELITDPIPFSILENGVTIDIPVSNTLVLGSVTVHKTGKDDIPLSGAVFGVYNDQEQKLAELTTGEDGTASSGSLPADNYYLKELTAPDGYVRTDDIIPFAIEVQGQLIEKTVSNRQGKGVLRILKTGEDGESLPGVVFDITLVANSVWVQSLITREDGTATTELPLGQYILFETNTVPGYLLPEDGVSFSLTDDGETVELSIQNQKESSPEPKTGTLSVVKVNEESEYLSGAVFSVHKADSDWKVSELTTDADGTFSLDLSPGGYYLLEQRAPEGYQASTEKISFFITSTETSELTIINIPVEQPPEPQMGNLLLDKRASDTDVPLHGAVFNVYDTLTDEKLTELITGEDGKASCSLLPGDYYLLEQSSPAGYRLSLERVSFQIVGNEDKEITIHNDPVIPESPKPDTGVLIITKVSEDTGAVLPNATFAVFEASTTLRLADITTGEDGIASITLPEGDYYLQELQAPAGYKLSIEKNGFRIVGGGTKRFIVTNSPVKHDETEPIPGILTVIKTDEKTGKKLKDAVFGIYILSSDVKVSEVTTDSDGMASLELPAGEYTLRELRAPAGYILSSAKVLVQVEAGKNRNISVTNQQIIADSSDMGSLLLIKESEETGERLEGAVFGVYTTENSEKISEIITDQDGIAMLDLEAGTYYLRELKAPSKHVTDRTVAPFRIKPDVTTRIERINALREDDAVKGTVEIYFRHVEDRRELSPMRSYTDLVGRDYRAWMRDNGLEAMPIEGYTYIRTDYSTSSKLVDGTLVVTLWYGGENEPVAVGNIEIPKTGEELPALNYILGALFVVVSILSAVCWFAGRKYKCG